MTLAPTWRSGWDSNPRGIAPKLISSQPRYDLFDTAADAAAGAPGEKPAVALAEPILTQCFLFRKEFSSILWVA